MAIICVDKENVAHRIVLILAWLLVVIVYCAFATQLTFNLFQEIPLGKAYDSLAVSLLRGGVSIDPKTLPWDGVNMNGQTVMYFGPFPALLRIFLNAIYPAGFGKWSILSTLSALLLAIIAVYLMASSQLQKNRRLSESAKAVILSLTITGLSLGTPFFLLISFPWIYQESIAWALCWSLWGLSFLPKIFGLWKEKVIGVFGLSIGSVLALSSRFTFGFSLCAVTIFAAFFLIHRCQKLASPKRLMRQLMVLIALIPALSLFAFHLWYNYKRYGNIWIFAMPAFEAKTPRMGFPRTMDYICYVFALGVFFLPRFIAYLFEQKRGALKVRTKLPPSPMKFGILEGLLLVIVYSTALSLNTYLYRTVAYWLGWLWPLSPGLEEWVCVPLLIIPTAFLYYFGVDLGSFTTRFPYVTMVDLPSGYNPYFFRYEAHISMVLSSPWTIVALLVGLPIFLSRATSGIEKFALWVLFVQSMVVLAFGSLEPRYCNEFLPLIVFVFVNGLLRYSSRCSGWSTKLIVPLVLYSCIATVLSSISWLLYSKFPIPQSYHKALLEICGQW